MRQPFFFWMALASLTFIPTTLRAQPYFFDYKIGQSEQINQFRSVNGITTDTDGSIYVVDANSNRIKKFDSQGNALLQWGEYGSGDGQFNFYPWNKGTIGITTDAMNNVYVSDAGNYRVQKFSSTGNYITKWGIEGTGDGHFVDVAGIAVDSNGDIYVADTRNDRIQKFSSTGTFLSKWKTENGNGSRWQPDDITIDKNNNIFIIENYGNTVVKFSRTGQFITKWGGQGISNGLFNNPSGIGVDPDGNIYVTDSGNNQIQKFSSEGEFITKWGSSGSGDGQLLTPLDVTIDRNGGIYVADNQNYRIQKFSPATAFLKKNGNGTIDFNLSLNTPRGISTDATGNVYIVDSQHHRIQKFSNTGNYITSWGSYGFGNGQFISPYALTVDHNGNVYVTDRDSRNYSVQKFSSTGEFISKWESDILGTNYSPDGIATDHNGNVYVIGIFYSKIDETSTIRTPIIKKFSPMGASIPLGNNISGEPNGISIDSEGNVYVSSISWITKFSSSGNPIANWIPINNVKAGGLAIDAQRNLYILDRNASHIQKFTSEGNFITKWPIETADNQFEHRSIAVDPNGGVYITDTFRHQIIKLTTGLTITSFSPLSGLPGNTVTIHGTGFSSSSGENNVKFNNITAHVVENSLNQLVVKVPEGASNGKISVATVGKTTYSQADFIVSPLVVTNFHFPEKFIKGTSKADASISINSTDALQSVHFFSRGISTIGNYTVDLVAIPTAGNLITYSIPASYFSDPIGIEGYFVLRDVNGNDIISESGHIYVNYPISSSEHAIPNLVFGSSVKDYQLISIPLNLTDNKVSQVFKNLGAYNNKKYRLYGYNFGNTELNNNLPILAGKGYWLIAKNNTQIVPGEGTTVTVTKEDPFSITLNTGWNLIGNPYNFNVLWSDVLAYNNNPTNLGNLRHYKNGTFAETQTLERYRGTFVYLQSDTPLTIKIPVIQNASANGRLKNNTPVFSPLNATSWTVPLTVYDGTIKNELAGIGMHPFAKEEQDAWDEVMLPFPGINSFNLTLREVPNATLIKDIVPTADHYTWTGYLSSTQSPTLSWDNSYFGDNEKELVLEIAGQAELVDMRKVTQTSIPSGTQTFFIHYGNQSYIESATLTNEIIGGNVFPNPFNKNSEQLFVTIALPTETADVHLSLTDMKGVTVKSSANTQLHEGRHTLAWKNDFSKLPSGLYVLRVTITHKTGSRFFYKKILIE